MDLVKVIITDNAILAWLFLEKYDFLLNKENEIGIYEWKINNDEEEKVYFIKSDSLYDTLIKLLDNYDIFKLIILSKFEKLDNYELEDGDIIFPNTFLWKKDESPIFLSYAIWENYDLKTFWIIFNWVCVREKNENEYSWDVSNQSIYPVLKLLEKKWLIDNTVSLWVLNSENWWRNLINILSLVV